MGYAFIWKFTSIPLSRGIFKQRGVSPRACPIDTRNKSIGLGSSMNSEIMKKKSNGDDFLISEKITKSPDIEEKCNAQLRDAETRIVKYFTNKIRNMKNGKVSKIELRKREHAVRGSIASVLIRMKPVYSLPKIQTHKKSGI